MRRLFYAVWLVAGAGCEDFSLVDPSGQPPTETAIFISVTADRSSDSHYMLNAGFFRGMDDRGRPIEPAIGTLDVEGDVLQPSAAQGQPLSTSPWWQYRWDATRPDGGAHADSLRVRPPIQTGSPVPGIIVTIPIPGREDPPEVTWVEGQDLQLHASPGFNPDRPFEGVTNWTLELGDACDGPGVGRALRISGQGTHPAELRIPWAWLPRGTAAPTAACLQLLASHHFLSVPYRTEASVWVRLAWRIRLERTSQSSRAMQRP